MSIEETESRVPRAWLRRTATTFSFAAAVAVVAAGCGGSGSKLAASSAGAATPGNPGAPIVLVANVANYGTILTTSTGFALYTYTADDPGGPGCQGECLRVWPPLMLPAGQTHPIGGSGVTGLGTFPRNGGLEVTYNGLPLYTFITDKQPGQVTGQNVVDSGGKWILATVASTPPTASSTTPAPTTPATVAPASHPAMTSPPATQPPATRPPATSPPPPPTTKPPTTSPPTTAPIGPPIY